jgi:hypothetical protein
MRRIKRLLLLAKELSIFLLGLILSLLLAVGVSQSGFRGIDLPSLVLFSGLLFTSFLLSRVRRKHAPQKLAYDVAGWALDQAERKLHPRRRKRKRILIGVLVSLPSALAMLVLFFFPVASHLRHPGSQYFRHYRVPIPWSVAVLFPSELDGGDKFRFLTGFVRSNPWPRFGMTTFREEESLSAIVTLGIRLSSAATGHTSESFSPPREATDILRREIRSNSLALICWQWRYAQSAARRRLGDSSLWNITCLAPADVYQQQFEANFYGRQESMPDFYRIVEGVSFVK